MPSSLIKNDAIVLAQLMGADADDALAVHQLARTLVIPERAVPAMWAGMDGSNEKLQLTQVEP